MSPSPVTRPATERTTFAPPAPAPVTALPAMPADPQAAIAAYIACILNGRPYPDAVRRAAAVPSARPDTVQEGIERILRGGAAR